MISMHHNNRQVNATPRIEKRVAPLSGAGGRGSLQVIDAAGREEERSGVLAIAGTEATGP